MASKIAKRSSFAATNVDRRFRRRRLWITGATRLMICSIDRDSADAQSVLPEALKSVRRHLRVPYGVRDIFVSQIVLQGSRVVAFIGELVTAGVAEHVRVD